MDRAIAAIWNMLLVAERKFRRLKASELMRGVYQGARYEDGTEISTMTEKIAA